VVLRDVKAPAESAETAESTESVSGPIESGDGSGPDSTLVAAEA
jgi:hypothetical protein